MRAVVVVRGVVDERDVWPYASWADGDGERTTLSVTVHDSQELVGVLSTLTALRLEVISTHLIEESDGSDAQGHSHRPRHEPISSPENDARLERGDDSDGSRPPLPPTRP